METQVLVYLDLAEQPALVGRLWARVHGDRESATFIYDEGWLARADRFPLEPALSIGEGVFHASADRGMFGAFGDSAPDRWGRALMRRAERLRAREAHETPRTLWEIDFLLGVDDESRQGALRFKREPDGPFLARKEGVRIPPFLELPNLLSAAEHLAEDRETAEELRYLLAPGSSLGGARPKASVRDREGHLSIVKFPRHDDELDVVMWEGVALSIAGKAGVPVPSWCIERVNGKPVLLSRRFDRRSNSRIPYLSAMSLVGARDHEEHSYLEIADALRRCSAAPEKDLNDLWRRMVLNILVSNTDDHLRNHGFLYAPPHGWRLSPAFDLNPVPVDLKPRILSTAIDEVDRTASLELAYEVSEYFLLKPLEARKVAAGVAEATSRWRDEALRLGIGPRSIDRMASAFEHDDLHRALK